MLSAIPLLGVLFDAVVSFVLWATLILAGVTFAIEFGSSDRSRPEFLDACCRFDGKHYVKIARDGYTYRTDRRSTVAFFPTYPLLGACLASITGWDVRLALLVVANLMLLSALAALSAYLHCRFVEAGDPRRRLTIGVVAVWPAGFFFGMAYSESTFLLFSILLMIGFLRRWPLPALALLSGVISATRPVGVAATAAFLWYVVADRSFGGCVRRILIALAYAPIGIWGLLGYMAYQYVVFDAPFAFAQTQENWTRGIPGPPELLEKVDGLLSFEPLWGCYVPGSPRYWGRFGSDNFLFNWAFWNPILFVGAFFLVVYGALKSWLTGPEVVLGLGLLAIPYLTRAYEMSMAAHGRFAAVVVPAYVVLGGLLSQWPEWAVRVVFVILAAMLTLWTALFASGQPFF